MMNALSVKKLYIGSDMLKIKCNICNDELNEPGIWKRRGELGFWDGNAESMKKTEANKEKTDD